MQGAAASPVAGPLKICPPPEPDPPDPEAPELAPPPELDEPLEPPTSPKPLLLLLPHPPLDERRRTTAPTAHRAMRASRKRTISYLQREERG
jgi:hypothetical protein